ncbi:polyprenyl synthetase family protein [Mariprofundus erugo]|uniref:Polyprenyl synthetase family protein n=1 Tax=Mariprofundus erugo TaxID=2528639 RepID=A0A5R9GT27_9PROT|nr:farnesyl diphosphate synthase [Mariprofundus erugo]TLS68099.1 polyprenyl synthetase family protein [Mariprofundus erugo]TLS75810.1 polyprenyl synthetase family protein [Mariprofundus erugo]
MQAPEFLAAHAAEAERAIAQVLDDRASVVPERLLEAMRYSLMAGGKRVRPALVRECYRACGGVDDARVLPAMMAIEAIHTYSLIHDDLPCMDDDDVRRGSPTCHRRFDEATAVLAADALQALAFELLASADIEAELRCELIRRLALAAGCQGMVGGQMMDMQAEDGSGIDLMQVERIHLHKTGALLCWCCEAGALLAGAGSDQLDACSRYGKAVGLLFQIADDILDATASSETLGKSAGKDAAQHKATYVSVLGLVPARELAAEMLELAIAAGSTLGEGGQPLNTLAQYIMGRDR